jgi:hypothetical protein
VAPPCTRLTVWYSALLLLAIAVFTATVLWLQWTLLVRQSDESLDTLSAAAVNVVESELSETGDLLGAAQEMESVVRRPDYVVAVFDADGATVRRTGIALPIALPVFAGRNQVSTATVRARDHHRWRVTLRSGEMKGHRFAVALAAPLEGLETQWGALVEACAIGIPLVLALVRSAGLAARPPRPASARANGHRGARHHRADARRAARGPRRRSGAGRRGGVVQPRARSAGLGALDAAPLHG